MWRQRQTEREGGGHQREASRKGQKGQIRNRDRVDLHARNSRPWNLHERRSRFDVEQVKAAACGGIVWLVSRDYGNFDVSFNIVRLGEAKWKSRKWLERCSDAWRFVSVTFVFFLWVYRALCWKLNTVELWLSRLSTFLILIIQIF